MKNTGIVRKVDPLGRLVLPSEIRSRLGLEPGTPVEIYTDGDSVVLKKYETSCALCGASEGRMAYFRGKLICHECIEKMKKVEWQ